MATPPFDLDVAQHWFAVESNNAAWDLLEKDSRSDEENDQLLHVAHASCHHWLSVGNRLNHQRALCLLANVHAAVGFGQSAIHFSQKAVALSELNDAEQTAFDRATTLACAVQAASCAGNHEQAAAFETLARMAGAHLTDDEELAIFEELVTIKT